MKKSFRFCNFWAQEYGFIEIVRASWAGRVRGNLMFIYVKKLKSVKHALIQWNKARVGNAVNRVKRAKAKLDIA